MNTEIWKNFTSDPTTGVSLVSVDGVNLFINEQSIRFFFDDARTPSSVIGKSMFDMGFPDEWVKERIKLFEQIQQTGEAVLLRTVWQGKQQFSWMSLIAADQKSDQDRILVITRRIAAGDEAQHILEGQHEVFNSNLIRLGELESLTPRELEILALLGQGMSIKQIAEALFRSVKTIENHRESIGRKLKKTRGIELASIAQSAGLMVEDSSRKRVRS
ncbi:MAG: response regulator transcription factor [Phycisphaerales bacterium]|nr:response regulator transcription factor [Phycisphaerales bacterium]